MGGKMATAMEDTVFGIIKDQLKEEHVLYVKSDRDCSVPRLCFTAVNTKLAQTLQCQVNTEEPGITLPAIKENGCAIRQHPEQRDRAVTLRHDQTYIETGANNVQDSKQQFERYCFLPVC